MDGGTITINPNTEQMITIPIKYGYWDKVNHKHVHDGMTVAKVKEYLLDQIEDIMGNPVQNYISYVRAFFGNDSHTRMFIPGSSNALVENQNFPLFWVDDDSIEYTAFWIKNIHSEPIEITWGSDIPQYVSISQYEDLLSRFNILQNLVEMYHIDSIINGGNAGTIYGEDNIILNGGIASSFQ